MNISHTRPLLFWLYGIAGMVLLMVVVGGITRLTGSGLSITDWAPILGAIPPLNANDWQIAFEKYQASPQFQKINSEMTLEGFKFIYFWEYIHRLIARMIGVVVLIPGMFFWLRGKLPRSLLKRVAIGFALGGMQALMGWLMVKSGLVDKPSVSHFRLAAHFLLALSILAWFVWTIRDLQTGRLGAERESSSWNPLPPLMKGVMGLLLLQFIYGAFVAGMKAGFTYNTFPLMNGQFLPDSAFVMDPGWLNFFENPSFVQWIHRYLGKALLVVIWILHLRLGRDPILRPWTRGLALTVTGQFLLGVLTVVYSVPLLLGVLHQFMAGVLVIFVTGLAHAAARMTSSSAQSSLKNGATSSILKEQLS